MRNARLAMLLGSACGLAMAMPAFAQDGSGAAASDEDDNIIIVTAQNRSQDVNDVPIAINVVTGEQLKQAGFSNMNDIDKIAPVVQLNQDQGTVKITVRGIGTNSADEAQDTSVVVNIDGEYINRPNIMGLSLFDMERVEVLRGPQGTLYGRNSTAGAINFITRKPGKEFGVDASASYGNYNAIRADGGIDLPLGDSAGIRVSGFYEDRDGYTRYPAGGGFFVFPAYKAGRSDDNSAYGGRVSLRFEPTDRLSVNLAGEYSRRKFTPGVFAYADLNAAGNGPTGPGCNVAGYVRIAPLYSQTLCSPKNTNFLATIDRGNYHGPAYEPSQVGEDTWALRGRIAYEFSDAATLTYIGGYRSFSADTNTYRALPVVYRSFNFKDEARTQSHELRLNGTIGGIVYQLGGFYFREKLARENGFLLPSFIFGNPAGPGTFLSYFGRDIVSESKSAFAQVEVPLGDTLTAVGGLRYTKNNRDAIFRNGSPFGAGPPDAFIVPAGTPTTDFLFNSGPRRKNFAKLPYVQTIPLKTSEDKITWLAGLNFKPNPDTLLFAKASTGFKGGGFDAVGNYKPETNMAIEAGWKQTFGDHGQHQFNLGAFRYDYKDLQVSVLLNTLVGGQVFNAGKAKIWGIEASGDFALDDDTNFHASVNYLNAKYGELFAQYNVYTVPGTGADVNGIGDLDPTKPGNQQPNFAGNHPPFSPEFIISAGLSHVFHLGSSTLTARADTTFKSKYFTDYFNNRDGSQKPYTQTDLSLEYAPESKAFTITAFVRNLENVRPLTYGSFVSAGPDDIFNWQFGAPRTYGVRASIDF